MSNAQNKFIFSLMKWVNCRYEWPRERKMKIIERKVQASITPQGRHSIWIKYRSRLRYSIQIWRKRLLSNSLVLVVSTKTGFETCCMNERLIPYMLMGLWLWTIKLLLFKSGNPWHPSVFSSITALNMFM